MSQAAASKILAGLEEAKTHARCMTKHQGAHVITGPHSGHHDVVFGECRVCGHTWIENSAGNRVKIEVVE